jgi:hypothetical protein
MVKKNLATDSYHRLAPLATASHYNKTGWYFRRPFRLLPMDRANAHRRGSVAEFEPTIENGGEAIFGSWAASSKGRDLLFTEQSRGTGKWPSLKSCDLGGGQPSGRTNRRHPAMLPHG